MLNTLTYLNGDGEDNPPSQSQGAIEIRERILTNPGLIYIYDICTLRPNYYKVELTCTLTSQVCLGSNFSNVYTLSAINNLWGKFGTYIPLNHPISSDNPLNPIKLENFVLLVEDLNSLIEITKVGPYFMENTSLPLEALKVKFGEYAWDDFLRLLSSVVQMPPSNLHSALAAASQRNKLLSSIPSPVLPHLSGVDTSSPQELGPFKNKI